MIQLFQLQQARRKWASLLLVLSLCLTAVSVTTRIAVAAADVWNLETFALMVYSYITTTAWKADISGIHLSRAIQPPLTTILPMSSQIYCQIQHSNMPIILLSQPLVMPSPFLTSLFPTVSLYLIAVSVTTRVTVNAADVWKLETLALIVYRYGAVTLEITKVVGIHLSWAVQPPLRTKLPMFLRINLQVRHHQVPVNSISQLLVLPSPFLTIISVTLDWIQSPVATREPIWHLEFPALTTFSPPSLSWWLYSELVHWQKNTFTFPVGKAGKEFVLEVNRLLRAYADGRELESIA